MLEKNCNSGVAHGPHEWTAVVKDEHVPAHCPGDDGEGNGES
jgi:hypothetical protein